MSIRWPNKKVVGLTGNIATGKSTVMRLAAQQGALTLDADKVVHEIMADDPSMQAAIAVAFGPEVRRADGSIDRAALAAIVALTTSGAAPSAPCLPGARLGWRS